MHLSLEESSRANNITLELPKADTSHLRYTLARRMMSLQFAIRTHITHLRRRPESLGTTISIAAQEHFATEIEKLSTNLDKEAVKTSFLMRNNKVFPDLILTPVGIRPTLREDILGELKIWGERKKMPHPPRETPRSIMRWYDTATSGYRIK